jgi:hypothetical protein
MALVSNSLAKANKLFAQVMAKQPVDPLADLTPDQVAYYRDWFIKFKALNSATPDALYEAVIERNGWTPNQMLDTLNVSNEISLTEAQTLYSDQLGKTR